MTESPIDRFVIRATIAVVMPLLGLVWTVFGVISPRRLGRVLEKTGRNLSEYSW